MPFDAMSGKLSRSSKVILRTRAGRTHSYVVEHPYQGKGSDSQQTMRASFGERSRQAAAILADPAARPEWERRYAEYRTRVQRYPTSFPRPCTTLRGFIISSLARPETNCNR